MITQHPGRLERAFNEQFGMAGDRGEHIVVRSPGRVNLIGEHTDYNQGFVLPAAIDKAIILVARLRSDDRCHLYASDLGERYECAAGPITKSTRGWPNYLLGVLHELRAAGCNVGGCEVVFGGDIPIGAGLSSSAAIEAGFAYALNELGEFGLDRLTLAKLAQRAENEFVGVRCGIMDQFVNLFGRERNVVRLDCRTLDFEHVPFDREDIKIVLCDTRVRRSLASSEYNVRRRQCEAAVESLRSFEPGIRSLRDVDLDFLRQHRQSLPPPLYQRSAYVVEENGRVLAACDYLRANDFQSFGRMMFASHAGLRDQYEVSSPELNALVEIAGPLPGVLGARMMGAGFGGCTINLVEEPRIEEFTEEIRRRYKDMMGSSLIVHCASIESGTAVVASVNSTV